MMVRIKIALFGVLVLVMSGCASTEPSRFYILTPISGSDLKGLSGTMARDVSISIGPISIPDYLDRQQIVTVRNGNEIQMAEFDRWAGSLKDSFSRVLSENLSNLLSTDRVFLLPAHRLIPIDYHIGVEVIQFDGELGGNAFLVARWGIFGGKDKKMLVTKKSSFTEPTGARGYEALVAAQSRTIGDLSREMAAAIKDISHYKDEELIND